MFDFQVRGGDGDSEFRVIQTNPRFYKNPFKRPEGALTGGREGAVDLDKLYPEGQLFTRTSSLFLCTEKFFIGLEWQKEPFAKLVFIL